MLENTNKKTKEFAPKKKLKALQDLWLNAGTRHIKRGELFEVSGCKCISDHLIANKQAIEVNE